MPRPLVVRCYDKMVFEVCRDTLEAKTVSHYDAWCYSDPRTDVEYLEFQEWTKLINKRKGVN
jgi:hypothetical protein